MPTGTTVLGAMNRCRELDVAAAQEGTADAIFDFSIEVGPSAGLFINEIALLHLKPPMSRQLREGQSVNRSYDAGRYAYADDPVKPVTVEASDDPTVKIPRLARADGRDLPFVLAWQYYLYDAEGRDLARASGTTRTIEAASTRLLDADVTIVWRLIAIMLKPTEALASGSKSGIARLKRLMAQG